MPPECLLQSLELAEESHGIQRSIHGHQPTLIRDVEDAAGQHSLEWCLSRSVRPPYAATRPRLGAQFHRRLKEVHIQAYRPIQLGQLAIGALTFEAIVANELPNNGTIPLFDKTLVVFVADPSTRERDLLAGAVGQQFLVDVRNAKLILSVSLHADATGSGLYGYAQPRWRLRRQVWAVSSNEDRSV